MKSEALEATPDQNKLLTIDQVSNLTKVPVPTIRKYVKRFHPHIPVVHGSRNACLYSSEAVRKLVLIRSLFTQNLPHSEILTLISGQEKVKRGDGQDEPPNTGLVKPDGSNGQGRQFDHLCGQVLEIHKFQLDLIKKVEVIKESYGAITEENTALKQKLHQQTEVSSDLTKRLWDLESEIRRIKRGQGFWDTIRRWLGVGE
jgi:DNA-binding transcriptional MerR regulator